MTLGDPELGQNKPAVVERERCPLYGIFNDIQGYELQHGRGEGPQLGAEVHSRLLVTEGAEKSVTLRSRRGA